MANTHSGTRKAFEILRNLPRVSQTNLKPNPGSKKPQANNIGKWNFKSKASRRQRWMPVGVEQNLIPFQDKFKYQHWNDDRLHKLSYTPITVGKLQMLIDLERIPTDIPIDLAQFSICGVFKPLQPLEREGGYLMQDEGMDKFVAEINLEVQWATEPIIAAIERAGSTITTAYYDPISLIVASDPKAFFKKGTPIPRRMLPPPSLIEYYSDPKSRGYLADPDAIAEERFVLAQKYGYELPDIKKSPKYELLIQRKDPRQIFYGLEPGWIVNLKDKHILKPKDPALKNYYSA